MSHPGEPSDSSAKEPASAGATELSPEDFERLSASFRPSWQLDEAPFTGPSSLSPSDIRALQGGDARAEVHALVQAKNGSHSPAKASGVIDPSESVIVEPTPPPAASRPMPVPVSVAVPTPAQTAPVRRAAVAIPSTRPRLASLELDGVVPSFARKSRTPLWLALGGGAVAAIGVGAWVALGGAMSSAAPTTHAEPPSAIAPTAEPSPEPVAPAPPPPAAAPLPVAAPPAPAPSPPITMRGPAPATAPASPPLTMRPAAPPSPPPARAPAPAPAPAPAKTPPRPKAAPTTIVRDVPF